MPTDRVNRGKIHHINTVYGSSTKGAPLEVYFPQNESEIDVLLMAGIHGDEPEGTVLLSEALRYILPEELTKAVVLCVNPDGMAIGTRSNANGVDLNRNFPTANWKLDSVYYRNSREEEQDIELSPGSKPASELESLALVNLIKKLSPNHLVAMHAPLACIEDPLFSKLSKWIAERSNLPLVGTVGYETPGSLGSWAADNDKTIITYELQSASLIDIKKHHLQIIIDLLTNNYKL
jgi:protein MpaA